MREVTAVVVRTDVGVMPTYSQTLPRTARSASVSRRAVTTVLAAWSLPQLTDSAIVVVTELVSNAADHASGPSIRVTFTRISPCSVRVAVIDMDSARPSPRTAAPGDERGRGLALVETMSKGWGVDRLPWGKRVWADLEAL